MEDLVVRLLSLRTSPASFSVDVTPDVVESRRFQSLPQFNRRQIAKFQELIEQGVSLGGALGTIEFPTKFFDDEMQGMSGRALEEGDVLWLLFQCLAWVACSENEKTIDRFTMIIECMNSATHSKFAKEVGEMFCLICHDAFQQQFTWSGNSLIPLVKHLYWNEALGMESGLILPMLTKKTMATGNNELIENVVSMITAIYEANKPAAVGCMGDKMMKALGKYLYQFGHNALVLVSYMSRMNRCSEIDSFYQSIPSIVVQRIASQIMQNDHKPFPKLVSEEKNDPNMELSDLLRQVSGNIRSITSFFPMNISKFITDLKVIIDNSAPESVDHIVQHGSGVIQRLAGYDLSVGVAAVFVEVLEPILEKTDASALVQALVSTVLFDSNPSVFGENRLSLWTETVRRAFISVLVNKKPKMLPEVMMWKQHNVMIFAEQCARILQREKDVDVYLFGSDKFLGSIVQVISELSQGANQSGNASLAKTVCLVFLSTLFDEVPITQVCFVADHFVAGWAELITLKAIPEQYTQKMYHSMAKLPDMPPGIVDFACKICSAYVHDPCDYLLVNNLLPLAANLIIAAKCGTIAPKKLKPVSDHLIKCLEKRPTQALVDSFLNIFTIVLRASGRLHISARLFNMLVDACESTYGDKPDNSLFVRFVNVMGISGTILADSIFPIAIPEIALVLLIVFRNSSLFDLVLSRLLKLAQSSEHNARMLHRGQVDHFLLKSLGGSVRWFGKEYHLPVNCGDENSVVYRLIETIFIVESDHQVLHAVLQVMNLNESQSVRGIVLRMLNRINFTLKGIIRPKFALGYRPFIKRATNVNVETLKKGFSFFFWMKKDIVKLKTMNKEFILMFLEDSVGRGIRISAVGGGITVQYYGQLEIRTSMFVDDIEGNSWNYYQIVLEYDPDKWHIEMRRNGEWIHDLFMTIDDIDPEATLTFGQLADDEVCLFDGSSPVTMGPFAVFEFPEDETQSVYFVPGSFPGGVDKPAQVVVASDGVSIPERDVTIIDVVKEELTVNRALPILLHLDRMTADEVIDLIQLLSLCDSDMNQRTSERHGLELNDTSQALFKQLIPVDGYDRSQVKKTDVLCQDMSAMTYLLLSKGMPVMSFQLYLGLRGLVENRKSAYALLSLTKHILLNLFLWSKVPLADFKKILNDWRNHLIRSILPSEALAGVFERVLIQGCMLLKSQSDASDCYKAYHFSILEEIAKRNVSRKSVLVLFSRICHLENKDHVLEYLRLLNSVLNDENKSALPDDSVQCFLDLPLNKDTFSEMVRLLSLKSGPSALRVLSQISNSWLCNHTLDVECNILTVKCIECLYHKDKFLSDELLNEANTPQSSFWYFWPIILGVLRNDCASDIAKFLVNVAVNKDAEFSRTVSAFYYVILLLEYFHAFDCECFRKCMLQHLVNSFKNAPSDTHRLNQSIDKLFVLSTCRLSDTARPNRSLEHFTPFFCNNEFSFDVLKNMWHINLDTVVLKQMFTDKDEIAEALGEDFTTFLKTSKIESSVKKMIKECMEMKSSSFEKIMDHLAGRISVGIRGLHSNIDDCLNNSPVIDMESVFNSAISSCISDTHNILLQGQNVVDELTSERPPPIHATFRSSLLHGKLPVKREPCAIPDFVESIWDAEVTFCDRCLPVSARLDRASLLLVFNGCKFLEVRISDITLVQYDKDRSSFEIYAKTCESIYLKFSPDDFADVETIMISVGFPILVDREETLREVTSQWANGELRNLEVIVMANILAGKSFHAKENSFIFPSFDLHEMSLPPPITLDLVSNAEIFVKQIADLDSQAFVLRPAIHQWITDTFGIEVPSLNTHEEAATEVQVRRFHGDAPILKGFFGDDEFFGIFDENGCFSSCTLSGMEACRCVAQHKTGMTQNVKGCCCRGRFLLFDPERRLLGKKFETGYHEKEATHVVNFASFYDSNTIFTVLDRAEIAMGSLRTFPDKRRVLKWEDDYIVAATVSKRYDVVVYVTHQCILKVLSINKGVELMSYQLPLESVKKILVTPTNGRILVEGVDHMFCISMTGEMLAQGSLKYGFTVDMSDRSGDRIVGVTKKGVVEWFDPLVFQPRPLKLAVRKCVGLGKVDALVGLQATGDLTVFRDITFI